MTAWRKWATLGAAISGTALAASRTIPSQFYARSSHDKAERARVALSHSLPSLDGARLEATVVEVTYGPGESSPRHSHPCPVIGYVVQGALRTEVMGQPEAVYKAGESFYEAPNGVHEVSANASEKEPATFLAYFVCDHFTPLSIDVPEKKSAGDK